MTIGFTLGFYWENGKSNGNYYNGLYIEAYLEALGKVANSLADFFARQVSMRKAAAGGPQLAASAVSCAFFLGFRV